MCVSSVLLQPGRPTVSWVASAEGGQEGDASDCPPLLYLYEAQSGVLHSGLGSPAKIRCVAVGASPGQGYKDDQGAGVPLL